MAGSTASADFPVTAGAAQSTFGGAEDIFIVKLGPTGNKIFATYLGGAASDFPSAIVVDAAGNFYVSGGTKSADFPISPGAFQATLGGTVDHFVTKFNSAGDILWSTYMGGSSDDLPNRGSVVLAADGGLYVSGLTLSVNFPTTPGAQQPVPVSPLVDINANNLWDFTLTRFNPDGTAVFSTYWGGSATESFPQLAAHPNGGVYLVGLTTSANTPVTSGAAQSTRNANRQLIVTNFSSAGVPVFSTYWGGQFPGNRWRFRAIS